MLLRIFTVLNVKYFIYAINNNLLPLNSSIVGFTPNLLYLFLNMLQTILMIFLIIFLILPILFGLLMISLYNSLVANKNQVDNAFASIDVLLKKRSDLIPNLVAVAQNYMKYEESMLIEITRLRSRAISGRETGNSRMELENEISRTLGNILISLEAYPELKTNQYFLQLLESLNESEEQISAARRFYNSAVTIYNNSLEMFPSNLIASAMNYRPRRVFVATEEDRQNVNIKNLFNQ